MPSPKKLKFKKLLGLLAEHQADELPFAVFCKPGEDTVNALLQTDTELVLDPKLTGSGFHLAPFSTGEPAVLIRPDFYYAAPLSGSAVPPVATEIPEDPAAREIYSNAVAQALDRILDGQLQKVVLSRRFSVDFPLDVLQFTERLLLSHPESFRFICYHPQVGIWAAATPETLLNYDGFNARTMALAGTKPAGEEMPVWSDKERSEQALVYDHIRKCFAEVGVQDIAEESNTLRAGTLWHLNTTFSASLEPPAARALLRQLHPTPAVCGTPLERALELIEMLENYDREYYTGFAGPSGLDGEEHFSYYVVLRCLQIRNNRALVYVGGGIVSGSVPDAEWSETVAKGATMLSLLQEQGDSME
ncbi:isochorismate synthase [Robiginitalea myxolifaciens]|uniref:Isochorismate synthase n=1 Tax=Robiginitalea myxolifaciens TaxID=400055 RepID=A0A1I6GTM6_9FLAO|nr:chorismate-binding protein [Robiginitalea myxolifaciens]SFR45594.1 isochorismate synthase [Robiginitalea myxolifaciens]